MSLCPIEKKLHLLLLFFSSTAPSSTAARASERHETAHIAVTRPCAFVELSCKRRVCRTRVPEWNRNTVLPQKKHRANQLRASGICAVSFLAAFACPSDPSSAVRSERFLSSQSLSWLLLHLRRYNSRLSLDFSRL